MLTDFGETVASLCDRFTVCIIHQEENPDALAGPIIESFLTGSRPYMFENYSCGEDVAFCWNHEMERARWEDDSAFAVDGVDPYRCGREYDKLDKTRGRLKKTRIVIRDLALTT